MKLTHDQLVQIVEDDAPAFVDANEAEILELFETGSAAFEIPGTRQKLSITIKFKPHE